MSDSKTNVSEAILYMPKDRDEAYKAFIEYPRGLRSEAAEVSADLREQNKAVEQKYRADKVTVAMVQRLEKLPSHRRSYVIKQLDYLIDLLGLDDQPELDLAPPSDVDPADSPVFDKTATAGKQKDVKRQDKATKTEAPPVTASTATGDIAGIKPLGTKRRLREEAEIEAERQEFAAQRLRDADEFDERVEGYTVQ